MGRTMIIYHLLIIFILWSSYTVGQVPKCEEPPDIDFGQRVNDGKTEYYEGDKAWYQCSPGTTLVGSEWIECLEKNWTPSPKCSEPCIIRRQELEDKKLALYNGKRRSIIILNNQSLEFSCAIGYTLIKPSLRTCVDGHMDLPNCISDVRCTRPPQFNNADMIGISKRYYFPGDKVTYQCLPNFQSEGSAEVTCIGGSWKGDPRCRDNSCGYAPQIQNAEIISFTKSRYQPGDTVSYKCVRPLKMYGKPDVVCINKTWSELPQCKEEVGKCGPPPPIDNGDILSFPLSEYAPESRVEYKCQKFYVLQGSQFVTCKNGFWTKEPTCLEACTTSNDIMMKHNIELRWRDSEKVYSRTGQEVEFRCKRGFREASNSPPFRARCIEGKINYPRCI